MIMVIFTHAVSQDLQKSRHSSSTENTSFSIKDLQEDKKRELLEFLLNYNEKGYVDF